MNIINKLSTGLLSTTFLLFHNQAAQAQSSEDEIKNKAQAITVEVVSISVTGSRDTVSAGSGVIVKKEGNLYFVVTNEHVVPIVDDYAIIPPIDPENLLGASLLERYIIVSVEKKLPSEDLALLTFKSTDEQNYDTGEIANSNNLSPEELNYVSGFPSATKSEERIKFVPVKITDENLIEEQSRSYKPLTYTPFYIVDHLEKGMSGGSILNSQGELIGIHQQNGESEAVEKICRKICVGIPIEIIQNKLDLVKTPGQDETPTQTPIEESPQGEDITTEQKIQGYAGITLGGFFPDDDLLNTGFGGSMFFGGKFTKNIGADLEFALLGGGTEFDNVDYTIWGLSINPKFFLPLTKKTNAPYLFLSPGIGISQADVDGVSDIEDNVRFTWQTKLGFGLPINKRYEGFAQIRYADQTGENAVDFFSSEVGISVNF